jgi:carbonic anhydrase
MKPRFLSWFVVGSIVWIVGAGTQAGPAHAGGYDSISGPEANEQVWHDFVLGNRRYMRNTPAMMNIPGLRRQLYSGARPRAMVLVCGDARTAPERVFDQTLGQLFAVRNAGNIADPVTIGSLEYAYDQQKPQLLIVLGHERCGMVKAACDGYKMTTPAWQAILDRINTAIKSLRGKYTGDELWDRATRANIDNSAREILAQSPMLRDAVAKKNLTLIQAYLHVETGEVERLNP